MDNNKQIIDGTRMVAKDIAEILSKFPMCEVEIDNNSLLILNHIGLVIKQIKLS